MCLIVRLSHILVFFVLVVKGSYYERLFGEFVLTNYRFFKSFNLYLVRTNSQNKRS